jgi:hypothetical protein
MGEDLEDWGDVCRGVGTRSRRRRGKMALCDLQDPVPMKVGFGLLQSLGQQGHFLG